MLKTLAAGGRPMSLKELETEIPTLDKSSIFRCLTAMREKDLLHSLEGGPEGVRYEICHSHGHHHDEYSDEHVHFHCEVCGRTFCFENVHIPDVPVPDGYQVQEREYTVKGICPDCR